MNPEKPPVKEVHTTGLLAEQPSLVGRQVTADVIDTTNSSFSDYALSPALEKGIYEKGFDKCSPVQVAVIPTAISGANVLCRAKNGTGKTAAYAIPLLHMLDLNAKHVQGLVLVPARELALQTSAVIKDLGKYMESTAGDKPSPLNICVTTGGTYLRDDILRLKARVDIVVATLGRLDDLASKNIINLSLCQRLVLDEADKLLSAEFETTCESIISKMHHERQIMMFSATFPDQVREFQDKYLPGASMINLMTELTLKGITQYYAYVEERSKLHCLHTLFTKLRLNQVIVFCNSLARVELLAKKLSTLGFPCYYIHSQMPQNDRNQVFHNFRTGAIRCLIATDLFTRGIDVLAVNVVINFDFPTNSETYLHRIGRSGRFGHLGLAVNLVTLRDRHSLYRIENELNTTIEAIPAHVDEALYT